MGAGVNFYQNRIQKTIFSYRQPLSFDAGHTSMMEMTTTSESSLRATPSAGPVEGATIEAASLRQIIYGVRKLLNGLS